MREAEAAERVPRARAMGALAKALAEVIEAIQRQEEMACRSKTVAMLTAIELEYVR
jgi:hypothetical protein